MVLKEGSDVTLISCGSTMTATILAAQQLAKKGISTRVINMHTIKPLDSTAVLQAALDTKAIITIEDHQIIGGLGSAIAEVLAQSKISVPFKIMGVQDSFGESGTADELLEKYGLTAKQIVHQLEKLLKH